MAKQNISAPCFGFQSTYQNKEGKYIEFIIINNRNIQIGNKSKNGLLTFLSTKEDYIYIKANTNEKKTEWPETIRDL